jgi:hypothetical protein
MNEDEILRDLIVSAPSKIEITNDNLPTIFSLQDTITLIEKKYGKEWRKYPECKCVVIWASSNFKLEHVKEIVPDLYDLCKEYKEKHTVNGQKFDDCFYLLAFYMIDPNTDKLTDV